jgi:hypothetical protein
MWRRAVRWIVAAGFVFGQLGCRSVYRFQCTSNPKGAVVAVEGKVQGQTDCTVEIPKDSDLIRDGKIAFTFRLPDGRAETKVVDVHGLKTANDLALIVSAPFLGAGVLLMVPWMEDDEDEEDEESANQAGLLGLGALGIGTGLFFLLGGDTDAGAGYPVQIDFNEPADGNAPVSDSNQPPPAVPAETES